MMVSAYASLVVGDDGHWFQRSGALMVLFSIGVHAHRKHLMRCIEAGAHPGLGVSSRVAELVRRFWRAIPFVCYLAIAIGTGA